MKSAYSSADELYDELAFAIDAAELGIWDLNPLTNTFKGNARLKDWFGLQPADEIPLPLALQVIVETDRERVTEAIRQALRPESGGQYDIVYTIVHPQTGQQRVVRAKGQARFGDDEVAYRFNGILQDITEQHQAEQIRQHSETYLRHLTDTVPAIIWETRPDGYCTYLNQQWYETTGQTEQEAEGFGWLDATHPDDKDEAGRLFTEANERQTSFSALYRLRQRDGTYRWSIDKASPRFSATGDYEGMVGTVVDVHEETMARQQVVESEVRFQTMAEGADVLIAVADEHANATYFNRAWSEFTGRSVSDLLNLGWADLIHPDDRGGFINIYLSAIDQRGPFTGEFRMLNRDGQYRWLLANGPVRFRPDGSFAGHISSCVDITERKQSEEALRASEQRFQAAVQAVQGVLWTNNARGEMEGEQPGWASLTGQPYDEYQGYGWAKAVHPDDAQPTIDAWNESLRRRDTFQFEHRVRTSAGTYEWFSIRSIPLLNPDGSIREWVGVHTNIDKQRRAEDAVRASETRLRSLIENAPIGIGLYTSRELVIELPNQTFIDIVGKGPDIVGKSLRELMPELHDQPFLQILDDVFTSRQPFRSFGSAAKIMRNGVLTENYYNITFTPLFNEAGAVHTILNIAVDVTEQIRTQQELEQQRTYLQNALSIADLGTFAVDFTTGMTTVSGNVRGWLGLPSVHEPLDLVLGKVHPDDLPQVSAIIKAAAESEAHGQHDFTYRVLNPAAGTLHIQSYGRAQYRAGRAETLIGVLQNVTPQVQARQRLEASEAKLRSVIDTAPVAIGLFMGRELVIELPNQTFIDIVGKGPDIAGKPLREVMPELVTEAQPFLQILDDVFTSGQPFQSYGSLVQIVRKGVMTHNYYNITYTPLFNEAGEVYAILDIAVDVTEQIRAQQQIEEAEAALRGAIELAQLGSWAFEVATNQFTYSDRVKKWFGFAADSVAPDKAFVAIHEADRARVEAAIGNALQPGSDGIYDVEYALTEPHSGRELIMHAQGRTTFTPEGQPIRLTGSIQDVTQDRRVQAELERQVAERTQQLQASVNDLERSNANLQQFAYVASHDLQEPLRKIMSFSNLLADQYREQLGSGTDLLTRMQAAASRMSTLISDLLTFSRINTRQESAAAVSLEKVINNALLDLDLRVQETGAVIDVGTLPSVQGDASQLGQLFQNLLNNALKFRKPDTSPHVQVRSQLINATDLPPTVRPTRPANAYHRIDVQDNGIGFDEKYTDRIFQVFQRLHGRSQYAGTGIGLAICEKVAANHGGAITAHSQPGEGATFSVYLPVK